MSEPGIKGTVAEAVWKLPHLDRVDPTVGPSAEVVVLAKIAPSFEERRTAALRMTIRFCPLRAGD